MAARNRKTSIMTDITTIPLDRLQLWDGNVRKTAVTEQIDELAESIAAHGLLQSIVVKKARRGRYHVVAGQRRLLALQALAERGTIEKDCGIPCLVTAGEIDAAELSLAENVVRAPMHPADQFEAFRVIIEGGATVADVAARFGMAESTVEKRLKLGRLSPVILEAFRRGEVGLEEAQAFTLSNDHDTQERVFSELPEWNRDADAIRSILTEADVPATDKRVRFIGLANYREAGGDMRRDLFDDMNGGYLTDVPLLERLVADKLSSNAAEVTAEGWSWVEIVPDADFRFMADFRRLDAERLPLSDDAASELEALSQEYDLLIDSEEADEDRLEAITQRMEMLSNTDEIWSADSRAVAGAILTLGHNGDLRIERGLVRKQDVCKLKPVEGDPELSEPPASSGLSPALVEDLSAHRSAAIGAMLLKRADIALVAVVHALVINAFGIGKTGPCLNLRCSRTTYRSAENCKGFVEIEQALTSMARRLPEDPLELFTHLLGWSQKDLLELLALMASLSVDAVQRKGDRPDVPRLVHASTLASALDLNMTEWFEPTAENYFGRVTRAQILADLDDAKGKHAPSLDKLKKTELAARAESIVAGSGWLPKTLRDDSVSVSAEIALAAE